MLAERLGGLAGLIAVIVAGVALHNSRQTQQEIYHLLEETRGTLKNFKNAYNEQQTNLDLMSAQVKAAREETVSLERELVQLRNSAQPVSHYQIDKTRGRKEKRNEAPRDPPVPGDIVGPVRKKPIEGVEVDGELVIQIGGNEKVIINDQKAFLGITPVAVDKAVAKRFGYPHQFGLWIVKVTPDQPGDKAGIQANDVLMRLNKIPLENSSQLEKILAGKRPGEAVSLDLFRNGEEFPLNMELGSRQR